MNTYYLHANILVNWKFQPSYFVAEQGEALSEATFFRAFYPIK